MRLLRHTSPNATSYQIITGPSGPAMEEDQVACVHCRHPWVIKPGSGRKRGWCLKCHGITCGTGACDVCIPYEDRFDLKYTELRRLRDMRAKAEYVTGIIIP